MKEVQRMTRQEAIKYLDKHRHLNPCGRKVLEESNEAIDMAIDALNHQTVFEQIKWERDVALQTLEEHGIGLGQIKESDTE